MASSSLHTLVRAVLDLSITVLCLGCVLAYAAGFAFHRCQQGPAAPLLAAKAAGFNIGGRFPALQVDPRAPRQPTSVAP
jgi:hypothetical protein